MCLLLFLFFNVFSPSTVSPWQQTISKTLQLSTTQKELRQCRKNIVQRSEDRPTKHIIQGRRNKITAESPAKPPCKTGPSQERTGDPTFKDSMRWSSVTVCLRSLLHLDFVIWRSTAKTGVSHTRYGIPKNTASSASTLWLTQINQSFAVHSCSLTLLSLEIIHSLVTFLNMFPS